MPSARLKESLQGLYADILQREGRLRGKKRARAAQLQAASGEQC